MISPRLKTLALALATVVLAAGLFASSASAASTRVSITDFAWTKQPTIDLGESVTWDWIGPDLQHSVTGQSANATQWDSEPSLGIPARLGSSFTVAFNEPGQYQFVCKIHSLAVRGTVTVTDQPGDPNSDPGPQDPLNFDLEPPQLDALRLNHYVLGHRGNGTMLNLEVSEKTTILIDYYILKTRGKGKKKRTVRRFVGYQDRNAHLGINSVRFGSRTKTFRPRAGKFVALVRAEDENTNSSPTFTIPFEIKAKPKKKKKKKRR